MQSILPRMLDLIPEVVERVRFEFGAVIRVVALDAHLAFRLFQSASHVRKRLTFTSSISRSAALAIRASSSGKRACSPVRGKLGYHCSSLGSTRCGVRSSLK